MNSVKQRINKKILIAAILGFIAGAVWFVAVRFVTYKSDNVHYHANFAVYVNGEREEFDNFTFYEEVEACAGDSESNPKTRVHMHNNENHIVHVHDNLVTWGHFLANLGYGLTNDSLRTDAGVFVNDDGDQLKFMLNGQEVQSVANRVIGNQDILLISYGSEDTETLEERFEDIPHDAGEYNHKLDPGGCGGNEELDFWTRLRRAMSLSS